MELINAIENRRSIRNFKNESISDEIILDILNCGRLAPSAKNRQPWYFVVLKGDKKNDVASIMVNGNTKDKIEYDENILKSKNTVTPTAKAILEASVLILVFKEKDNNWLIGDNLSIGACIQNMCLRATDLNLGSLWIRDISHTCEEISKFVNKENLELNSALAIGVANEFPKQRPRKELKDIVEWL